MALAATGGLVSAHRVKLFPLPFLCEEPTACSPPVRSARVRSRMRLMRAINIVTNRTIHTLNRLYSNDAEIPPVPPLPLYLHPPLHQPLHPASELTVRQDNPPLTTATPTSSSCLFCTSWPRVCRRPHRRPQRTAAPRRAVRHDRRFASAVSLRAEPKHA